MEFRLLKQLDPTFTSNVLEGPLSSSPAVDFINPGLGNIVRPFGLYVPLYLYNQSHKKVKGKSEQIIEQEGAGKVPIASDIKEKPAEKSEDSVTSELNNKKKQLLDEAIYQSFLHPRVIKTDTIILKRNKLESEESKSGAVTNAKSGAVTNEARSEKPKVVRLGAKQKIKNLENGSVPTETKKLKHSFNIVD